jgi:4-nitrophenyl phosphatase
MDVNISYSKIARAFTYLKSKPDCHFLATNTDLTYPSNNDVYPGTGALLAALTTPLQRDPIVLGKPHKPMLDAIIAK